VTQPIVDYLRRGLREVGLPETRILVGRTREEAYRTAPAALVRLVGGSLRRDGSRVEAGPERTTRRLYQGVLRARVELYARNPEELDRMLVGLLLYLWATPLTAGGAYHARLDDLSLVYTDEEGVLLTENALALEIPFGVEVLDGVAWVPVEVEVEGLVEEV